MVMPFHESFHPTLDYYEYNITKAQMYMDMWRYSQAGQDYTKAPLGDHDFSGFVEIPDYPKWVRNLGKYASELPWWPSNPVDPDNNNDGQVLGDDIITWGLNFGKRYPFRDPWN